MSASIKLARAGYRGDPGLFGFLGGLAKKVTGVAGSVLPGPLGAAARTVSRVIPGGSRGPSPAVTAFKPQVLVNRAGGGGLAGVLARGAAGFAGTLAAQQVTRQRDLFRVQTPVGSVQRHIVTEAGIPGAAVSRAGGPSDGTMVQRDDILVAGCPQGMRPNKSAYYEMSPTGSVIYHPPGTKCVRIRRRNPANARATDRAIGRVTSAKRYAQKLSRITIRKKCD